MASKYSVAKRGKVYYLRHRITPYGRQVWVSLKTPEQREAYRKAKSLVREAELRVALSRRTPEQDAEFDDWHQRLPSPCKGFPPRSRFNPMCLFLPRVELGSNRE